MPKIGNGSNKRTRHVLPSGFKKITLRNVKDLDLLLMNNRTYAGEIANAVSAKKRALIVEKAKFMNVRITNATGKLRKQANE